MKRSACLLITAMVLSCIFPAGVLAQDKIRVSVGEWPPFLSESLKYHGVAARIVTEAFKLEHIKVEYAWFPWKRAFENVKNGDCEASAIWTWSAERAQYVEFSDPITEHHMVFFYLKEKPLEWKTLEDLKGMRIGAMLGYHYGEAFDKAEKSGQITVERIAHEEANFKKLLARRVDLVVVESDVGHELMKTRFSADERKLMTSHPTPVNIYSNHIVVSKKLPHRQEFLTAFNKGLKQLKISGKFDRYFKESREGAYRH